MKLLGSIKDVNKDKHGENIPKLESVEVVLVHCNLVKNDYQQTPKTWFTFVPNKEFVQLINIPPVSLTMITQLILSFLLLKFGLQIKLVNYFKLKIMSIWP